MTAPSAATPAASAESVTFTTLKGPTVPRSHSFLPLRCGPPIYFPLPAPYDSFCLTTILPSDKTAPSHDVEAQEDVEMNDDSEGANNGESSGISRDEGMKRIDKLGDVESTGGWEYPFIRRTEEIKALNTDSAIIPAIIGTFSFKPRGSGSDPEEWLLEDVWICPEEREKGLGTLVITYIIHSWFLRLLGPRPRIIARAVEKDIPSTKFLKRLGFIPHQDKTAVNGNSEGSVQYIWRRPGETQYQSTVSRERIKM